MTSVLISDVSRQYHCLDLGIRCLGVVGFVFKVTVSVMVLVFPYYLGPMFEHACMSHSSVHLPVCNVGGL